MKKMIILMKIAFFNMGCQMDLLKNYNEDGVLKIDCIFKNGIQMDI
jgi:hypothetical protein